jgi:membrane protein YdbS with pleckstrin-like domain/predicted RNA-binding Zn-ribbon protein involved in translation (DUF1610 family)
MALELFPRELTRKQYGLRLLAVFAFVAVGVWLFVAALIPGYVYLVWVLVAWAYTVFGLAVPRLRNAGKSIWWALFFLIPRLNLIPAIVLLFIRKRSPLQPSKPDELGNTSSGLTGETATTKTLPDVMEVKFNCPTCGQDIPATRAEIGVTVQCPHCNAAVSVPNTATASPSLPSSPQPPTPPAANTLIDIYVYKDGKQLGPFENAQVAEGLRNGRFSYDDVAWREGWTDWRPLRTLFPPPPPPSRSVDSGKSKFGEAEHVVWTGNPSHWLYAELWILAIILLPFLVGLIIIPWIYLQRARRVYRVTTTKVEIEYGIWIKSSNQIRICDIRSINVTRRGLAGLAGVGNLEFSSAATDRAEVVFAGITELESVRQIVSKLQ